MATNKPDLSEFFKYSRPKKKPCAVGYAITQLTSEEQSQLAAACAQDNGIITSGAIQQWLSARKHEVTVSAIVSHRKGVCSCGD